MPEYYSAKLEDEWHVASSMVMELPLADEVLEYGQATLGELVECFLKWCPRDKETGEIWFSEEEAIDVLNEKVNNIIICRYMNGMEKKGMVQSYVDGDGEVCWSLSEKN